MYMICICCDCLPGIHNTGHRIRNQQVGAMFSNQFVKTVLRDNHALIRQGVPRLISTSATLHKCSHSRYYIKRTASRSLQQWKNEWSCIVHPPITGVSHWSIPKPIRLYSTSSRAEDHQEKDAGEQCNYCM